MLGWGGWVLPVRGPGLYCVCVCGGGGGGGGGAIPIVYC